MAQEQGGGSGSVGSGSIWIESDVRTVSIGPTNRTGASSSEHSGEYDLAGNEIPPGIYRLETVKRLTLIRTHVEPVA